MKWYIQLDGTLFPSPDNPSNSEHEAEQKVKGMTKVFGRGWDAFRVFQASSQADAQSKAAAWWKTQQR